MDEVSTRAQLHTITTTKLLTIVAARITMFPIPDQDRPLL